MTKTLSIFLLLRLDVPVNNFSVMSGRSHRFLGITSTFRGVNVSLLNDIFAQGHNTAEVGIESPTPRSGDKTSDQTGRIPRLI